ncbi:MAG: DNA-3-methyladenine glycosylase 2 family protein [Lachnospiraceae bacterium]|nr:DNA-3-methyladenine glycosylase 2 family protein [Lachnospiraceae bacterium]
MRIDFRDDLNLELIAESGQCFRWVKVSTDDNPVTYRIIAGGRVLFISMPEKNVLDLSCSENVFHSFWSAYLDSETNYGKIRKSVDRQDNFLMNAAEYGKGIRILCQDPWECLISFIISQRKSIPAIRSGIEKLCEASGKKISLNKEEKKWLKDHDISTSAGEGLYSFPSPRDIAGMTAEELNSCSVGYRAPYIRKAAESILSGEFDPESCAPLNDNDLQAELMKLYGVGKKVASCVALFGFHRLDFFPIDVWIERVLARYYENVFPFDRYAPYNGVMQQYMFFYGRSIRV